MFDLDTKKWDKPKEETIKTHNSFLNWIMETSKKIVTVTFIIFVLVNIFSVAMILITDGTNLETLISETHLTFREVIGGYFIKAALENSLKIGGSVVSKYIDNKFGESDC